MNRLHNHHHQTTQLSSLETKAFLLCAFLCFLLSAFSFCEPLFLGVLVGLWSWSTSLCALVAFCCVVVVVILVDVKVVCMCFVVVFVCLLVSVCLFCSCFRRRLSPTTTTTTTRTSNNLPSLRRFACFSVLGSNQSKTSLTKGANVVNESRQGSRV